MHPALRRIVSWILLAQGVFVAGILFAAGAAQAEEALPTKPYLTLAAARRVAAAAEAEAAKRELGVVVAVVDEGGALIVLERLDAAQVASVDVAIAKARTAAIFRRPSRVFEEQVKNGPLFPVSHSSVACSNPSTTRNHQTTDLPCKYSLSRMRQRLLASSRKD